MIPSDHKKMSILAGSMRIAVIFMLLLTITQAQGQLLDIAKVEYLYVPSGSGNFEYHRQAVEINAPIKLNDKAYFFLGLDYSRMIFRFREETDSYDKSGTENFKSLDLNLTYTTEMKNNWRFGIQVTPSFNSNLTGSLIANDFLVNAVMVFVKSKEISHGKKSRLMLGLGYSTTSRFPGPFPFINYYRKFHPKWSYTIGAPYSNIQYHASEKHRLKIHAEGEAFNASIQEGVLVQGEGMANRLRVLLVNVGFRYEYKFADYLESYFIISRTVRSDLQLRDNTEVVFRPPLDSEMFYRVGVRFKI